MPQPVRQIWLNKQFKSMYNLLKLNPHLQGYKTFANNTTRTTSTSTFVMAVDKVVRCSMPSSVFSAARTTNFMIKL